MSRCRTGCCWTPYSMDSRGERACCWYLGRCNCHTDERDERARLRAITQEYAALEDTWTR